MANVTPRRLYRIVESSRPSIVDFTPTASDRPPILSPSGRNIRDGISVYSTFRQAARKARGIGRANQYIAELAIESDDLVSVERTLESAGHHTVWGDATIVLNRVRSVVPVPPHAVK